MYSSHLTVAINNKYHIKSIYILYDGITAIIGAL